MTITYPFTYDTAPIGSAPQTLILADGPYEPVLFLSPYYSDLATIAASTVASAGLPATLMQTMQPSERWRSTEKNPYVRLSFQRPIAANMLEMTGTNLLPGDVVRIRAFGDSGFTTGVLDTGYQDAWRMGSGRPLDQIVRNYSHAIRFTNTVGELLYWQIDIVANNGQSYVEVGRLMLGKSFQPTISCDNASDGFSNKSPAANQLTDYFYTFTEDRGLPIRTGMFRFSMMDETEAFGEMLKMRQLLGLSKDFFLDLFPGRVYGWENTAMQATFSGTADFIPKPYWNGSVNIWGTAVSMTEVG